MLSWLKEVKGLSKYSIVRVSPILLEHGAEYQTLTSLDRQIRPNRSRQRVVSVAKIVIRDSYFAHRPPRRSQSSFLPGSSRYLTLPSFICAHRVVARQLQPPSLSLVYYLTSFSHLYILDRDFCQCSLRLSQPATHFNSERINAAIQDLDRSFKTTGKSSPRP